MQMQLGPSTGSDGVVQTAPAPVDRLTMVTTMKAGDWAIELPRPLFLQAGDQVWVAGAAVFVRRPSGEVTRHDGNGFWICR